MDGKYYTRSLSSSTHIINEPERWKVQRWFPPPYRHSSLLCIKSGEGKARDVKERKVANQPTTNRADKNGPTSIGIGRHVHESQRRPNQSQYIWRFVIVGQKKRIQLKTQVQRVVNCIQIWFKTPYNLMMDRLIWGSCCSNTIEWLRHWEEKLLDRLVPAPSWPFADRSCFLEGDL
jgi:hypothetical protein